MLANCGTAPDDSQVAIVAPDTREVLPVDRVGEIWVRGESVAAGYWGKPALTQEVFRAECDTARPGCADGGPQETISDPAQDSGSDEQRAGHAPPQPGRAVSHWLRTGDLGFLHEGELYPCGRLKDMIKLRGRNLYPQDIEAAIAAALPWLAPNGCAAFVVEKDGAEAIGILIEADRTFARVLKKESDTARPGCEQRPPKDVHTSTDTGGTHCATLTEETLGLIRQAVTEECEAAPALIAFTGPADFPRTTSGKVQRHAAKLIATTPGDARVLFSTRPASSSASSGGRETRAEPLECGGRAEASFTSRSGDTAFGGSSGGLSESTHRPPPSPAQSESGVAAASLHSAALPPHSISDLLAVVQATLLAVLRDQVDASFAALDVDTPLARYGMDSLATAEAAVRLEKATGRKPSSDLLAQATTAREVAALLAGEPLHATASGDGHAAPPPKSAPFPQRMAKAMERIHPLRAAGRYPYHSVTTDVQTERITVDGKKLLMMASFEYLQLGDHPRVIEAHADALKRFGSGSRGAQAGTGRTSYHEKFERRVAALLRADDAILFSSGYLANLAAVSAMTGADDLVAGDALNHACIVDGCRLSGVQFQSFAHNNVRIVERLLAERQSPHALVVVEGAYSMDGDIAPLPQIVAACQRHGAIPESGASAEVV